MGAPKDLSDMEFGGLKVLGLYGYKVYPSGVKHRLYECECKCGKVCYVTSCALTSGHTKSCGCMQKDHASKLGRKMGNNLKQYGGFVDGTRIDHLTNKPTSRSTTGVRVVTYKKDRNKYEASICFKQKHYYLGAYYTLDEAAQVRRIAEEKLFGEFLDWYNEFRLKDEFV